MVKTPEKRGYQEVLEVCLLAGKLMIEGGSEMYRVEDTMLRIAKNAGMDDPRVFATPTCVFMSLDQGNLSQMQQIRDRNINLELVSRVNKVSRDFADKKIDFNEVQNKIKNIKKTSPVFPLWLQVIGAAALSATLMVLFMNNYDWIDFPAAALSGAVGYLAYVYTKRFTKFRFLSELIAAMVMGIVTVILSRTFTQMNTDNILIGALMTLVPGLAFTNALRDLFMGDLLSGVVRIFEAGLTAVALGGGVAIVIKFLGA